MPLQVVKLLALYLSGPDFKKLGTDTNLYALVFGESVLNDAMAREVGQSSGSHLRQVNSMLKERLEVKKEKKLPTVDYKKYSKVQKSTLGLSGGKDKIAIIRASGSISRVRGSYSLPGSSSIVGEQFIEKIRTIRESKRYKAAIIRIDSPGGDALASDLMWREIKLLAASKPVIASMSDVAASGGYYMAMAENLTLTATQHGVAMLSGFSKNLLKMFKELKA